MHCSHCNTVATAMGAQRTCSSSHTSQAGSGLEARNVLLLLLMALMCLWQPSAAQIQPSWRDCNNELQIVLCGQIPLTREYRRLRLLCCRANRKVPLTPEEQATQAAAAEAQSVIVAQVTRTDVPVPTGELSNTISSYLGTSNCLVWQQASIPTFTDGTSTTNATVITTSYSVPQLTKSLIQNIKSNATAKLPLVLRTNITQLRRTNTVSGFIHPGAFVGPSELILMSNRLSNASFNPVQATANNSLITGNGVPPKKRTGTTWTPPTNCTPTYGGPYPMGIVKTQYSGIKTTDTVCNANYTAMAGAPTDSCGHIAFVELDGQMAYKQAVAWYITKDPAYARKVFEIADRWASVNTIWGLNYQNGPLEAGWGIAAMARALEVVRSYNATSTSIPKFVNWVRAVPMKDMDYYVYNLTVQAKAKNMYNWYGNWHTTIAEAYMSVGVLSDNRTLYNQGVQLFKNTVDDYLKWGKGSYTANRILGECSETMRDMYHSQFGLGGLLQAAEIAWQQDDDLYSYGGYALAAAMELHARVTNAGREQNGLKLPPNYRFYNASSMPPLPAGATAWQFNITRQLWTAVDANGRWLADLQNGIKYMLGIGFLPTGWELGYNHYVGRLGMRLPETALLLSKSWPEWQEFHWGLGTVTHAQTAEILWRPGLTSTTVCNTPLFISSSAAATDKATVTEAAEAADAASTTTSDDPGSGDNGSAGTDTAAPAVTTADATGSAGLMGSGGGQ